MAVESLCRAAPALIVAHRLRAPGPEVLHQRPGPYVELASLRGAVQVLTALEIPTHRPHQAVQHVASAVSAGMVVRQPVLLGPPAQLLDLRQDPRRLDVPPGPLPQ